MKSSSNKNLGKPVSSFADLIKVHTEAVTTLIKGHIGKRSQHWSWSSKLEVYSFEVVLAMGLRREGDSAKSGSILQPLPHNNMMWYIP